jgi:hypothetical protein
MVRDDVAPPSFLLEDTMGSKPSHAQPSNRPESGGTDPDERREETGLLERDKQTFAKSHAEQSEKKKHGESSNRPAAEGDDVNR